MTLVFRWAFVLAATTPAAWAQEPPPKPDTTRRPVSLPTVQTTAPREERVDFETKPNVGIIRITGKELTSAPRFFGESDVLRAMRMMPGVNARNDYSVGMNVRGGETDQNLVLLDGYPIYNPFHAGGLFGAFVEPMVDRVDFLTGGFPASYGGRLSSVLDVRSAKEPRNGIHGRTDVSLIATTLALGSGMQGGRGTWTIAARRTYADRVADVIKKGSLPYHFRDFQAHVTRELPGAIKLSVTGYDNIDHLDQGSTGDGMFHVTWGNRLLGATLQRTFLEPAFRVALGDSVRVEQRLSASRFKVDLNLFDNISLNNRVADDRIAGSATSFAKGHTRSAGYELSRQRFSFDANYPLLLYPSDTLVNGNDVVGVFYDELWRPNDKWIVQAGARVDAASGAGAGVFQPRVSLKYFLTRNLAVSAAAGTFAQTTHSLAREDVPFRAMDFWVGSTRAAPMSRAQHYIAGVERWFSASRALRVETFYKRYSSLVEQNPFSDPGVPDDEFLPVRGHSYGGDVMLRQMGSAGHTGWLAYSYSVSSRVDALGRHFWPGHDRRHELNVVSNRIGRKYTFSMRFNLASGTPYSRITGEFPRSVYDPITRAWYYSETQFLAGPRNAERLPLAQRLDLSVSRNAHANGGVSFMPFLSVMNAYNAKNVFMYVFDYADRPPKRVGATQFPIFPTFGVSVVW